MTSKKQQSAEGLRAITTSKNEAWRAAVAVTQAKRSACAALPGPDRFRRGHTRTDFLYAVAWREQTEAEAAEEQARHEFVLARTAEELVAGDELALERDPRTLLADLTSIDAEKADLQQKIRDVERRHDERLARTFRADIAHAERCATAGEPPCTAVPRPVVGLVFGAAPPPYATKLAEHAERARDFTTLLVQARADELRIGAELEERAREEEAEKKRVDHEKRARDQAIADEQRAIHAQERANAEAARAERARREQLAADFAARVAGGAQ